RARQMARGELAGTHLRPAQCRPSRVASGPCALSVASARACAMAGALHRRERRPSDRRLLRHHQHAYRRLERDACTARRRRHAAARQRPARGVDSGRRLALRPDAAAAGERLSLDRRALQRQWLDAEGTRPRVKGRRAVWIPAVASLYAQTPLRQESAYLSIGERCNANGSKRFRAYQESGNWDGCVETAREQIKEGSHAIDLCTAYVGRDEAADMTEAVRRMRGGVAAPLAIDSTELGVLEAALKLYGGKPVVNSINFE